MSELRIERLMGTRIQPYISDLALLRIKIFHEFPYLYEGDLEYEKKYLTTYTNSPHSVFVLVFDGNKVVGVSTAIPLRDETKEVKAPFADNPNYDINTIFYLGESLLLHEYRGKNIGRRFFAEREAAAREQHCKITAFMSVERPFNHPSRPKDWHPLDNFWKSLGYTKHPELQSYYHWKEVGQKIESAQLMTFWLKHLGVT